MQPHEHLCLLKSQFPNTWKLVDKFRMKIYEIPSWPEWCLLPSSAWYAIVAEEYRVSHLSPEQIQDVSKLAAIGTWRYTQGIYYIDPYFYETILRSFLNKKIEPDIFYALPEWCLYIKTPSLIWHKSILRGFWVHLEWDATQKEPQLKIVLNTTDKLETLSIPFNTFKEFIRNSHSSLATIVALVDYVSRNHRDFFSEQNWAQHPKKCESKLRKGKFKLFPVSQTKLWKINLNSIDR